MPNIQEFNAGNLSIRPSEEGVQARAGTARRIGMFSNQQAGAEETLARETSRLAGETQNLGRETSNLGAEKGAALASVGRAVGSGIAAAGDAAVKYLDHEQISKTSANFSALTLQKTKEWDALSSQHPDDPTIGAKFLSSLNDDLEQFKTGSGLVTENAQKFAEAHADAFRQHMAEKITGDMASNAAQDIAIKHRQTVNQLSATVHADPSSLDFAMATLRSTGEGLVSTSPNLGAKAGAVRMELNQSGNEALVKSAAIGYIEKTGKMPGWVTDPKYAPYVNATELTMFEKQAKAQAKVDALTTKQTELAQRQLNERNAEGAANKNLTDNVKLDPQTGRPMIGPQFFKAAMDIARMPDAPQGLARTLIDWGEHQQNVKAENVVSDGSTKQDLTDRLFDPSHPTTRIDLMKAQVAGKLSNNDFTSMERLVTELETSPLKGPVWQDTADAVKGELILSGVGLPGKDIPGQSNYAKWAQTFIPDYLAKSRAGTLPPNALDVKDPTSMISQSMAPFKRTVQQRAQDYLATLGGVSTAAPARNDTMPAIPPPAQRPPGSIYETPRGKMKWTGTGWVAP